MVAIGRYNQCLLEIIYVIVMREYVMGKERFHGDHISQSNK